jgi:hypothetical protein
MHVIAQMKARMEEKVRQKYMHISKSHKNWRKSQKKFEKFEKNSDPELSCPRSPTFYVQHPTKKIREVAQVLSSILTPNMPVPYWLKREYGPQE